VQEERNERTLRANDVAPLQGAVIYPLVTGGLRFASTTGYYLAAFQAAIKHFAANTAEINPGLEAGTARRLEI